ncbi:hypothetical protein GGF42_008629, partial [Coemansia sp. RSA 2424]
HCVTSVLQSLGVKTLFGERVVSESSADNDGIDGVPTKHAEILPEPVDSVKRNATLITSSGLQVYGDVVLNCLGTKTKASLIDLPSSSDEPVFSPNGIRVNESMQVDDPNYCHIFAAGDISNKDVLKFAGPATKGGRIAAANIAKLIRAPSGETPAFGAPSRKDGRDKKGDQKTLVLGERHAVIQRGAEVVPTEAAIHMMSPDIKLSKVTRKLFIGTYPTHGK